MATRLATRPADEERFREFRARRLAKKESDREKLAAEFPLLFNNKAVGNKVTNTTMALNKSATVVTPGKRKSMFTDKNDENCSSAANKIASKPVLGAKTPLSSKKQRKGSLIMSPKGQNLLHQQAGLSKTLPAIPTYTTAAAPGPAIARAEKTNNSNANASVAESRAQFLQQAGLELTSMPRAALFADAELEHCTSGRSSISSLGESVAPAMYVDEASPMLVELVDLDAETVCAPTTTATTSAEENAVQEQVLDALDYLLELDEVDEQTYRRMSSTNFSAKAIKRLSMTMGLGGRASAANEGGVMEGAQEDSSSVPMMSEDTTAAPDASDTNRSSTCVSMEVAYPAPEADDGDCVVGELDVLNALRNYLSTLSQQQQGATEEDAAPAKSTADASVSEDGYQSLSTDTAPSTRSSTSSSGTFEGKEEWRDSFCPTASDTAGGATAGAAAAVVNKHPNRRLSISSNEGSTTSVNTNSNASISTTGRSSVCSTMRVSFCSNDSNNRLSMVPPVSADAPATIAEAPVAEDTNATTAPAAAPIKPKGVMTHPLADLLDDALLRGLVVPQVTRRLEMGNHTKYVVETQILAVPGYPEANSRVRMMGLKRYSDFKTLRAALVDLLEARRRTEARASLNGGGSRSSMEGGDILSIARSRRSSVDHDRESLLLNARDSLCGDVGAGFGGMGRQSISEMVPPLPSRQLMSMSCSSAQDEVNFQEAREACLRNWVEAVFSRQSCECELYRLELRKFLSAN